MAVLCEMPTMQYSANRQSEHKLFTSCIRQCLVSLPATEWCQRYLPCCLFTVSNPDLHFFHVSQPGGTVMYMVYPISDIGHCEKFGYVSCTEGTSHGNDSELIVKVKMDTRHPVNGSFGSEFLAICNHCRVMAAWSCKTFKFCDKFSFFLEKNDLLW